MNKKILIISILEALVFIGIIIGICHNFNIKQKTVDQNIHAYQNHINELVLENNDLLTYRASYIVKEKELTNTIDILKSEKKDIEKKLHEKIAYISNINAYIKMDTVYIVKDAIYIKDSIFTNIEFDYNDKWMTLKGNAHYKNNKYNISLYDINIPAPIKTGLTNDYTIFIESSNPYLTITSIEGAVIDGSNLYKKPKRFNFGIQAGFGPTYGLINRQFDIGIYLGIGIEYNF